MAIASLVTGASRSIGPGSLPPTGGQGPHRPADACDPAAAAAASAVGARPLRLDVTDPASIAGAAATLTDRYGNLDVLVSNAAITYDPWQRGHGRPRRRPPGSGNQPLGPWLMVQRSLPLLCAAAHIRAS
jgi:NAD(P)-dependent dehydrogenase (short-subunit alcohol dehydrogenase family)